MSSSEQESGQEAPLGAGSPPPRPTWVKVLGIAVALIVLAAVALALMGGGEHGPGRHIPGGDHDSLGQHE